MYRLMTPVYLGTLLIVSALSQSVAADLANAPAAAEDARAPALVGASVAGCAGANSDYERYELGCAADEAIRAVAPALSAD